MGRWLNRFFGAAAASAIAVVLATACGGDGFDNSPDEALKLSVGEILVNNAAQTVTIGVTARDEGWSASGAESWYTLSAESGERGIAQVTVTFAANDSEQNPDQQPRESTLTFRSGGVEKSVLLRQLGVADIPLPHENADAPINKLLFAALQDWYYNGEPKTAPADFNQDYDHFYFNYLSNLKLNENYEGNIWARDNERFIYSYIERNPVGTAAASDPPQRLNYGMEFDLVDFNSTFAARILYVEPGSPAASAGLKRGDWFWEVNGTRLADGRSDAVPGLEYYYQRFIDTLVRPVAGESPRLGMLTYRYSGGGQLIDEKKRVTVTPQMRAPNPRLYRPQIIEEDRLASLGGETTYSGYLMWNNFDAGWENLLVETFAGNFAGRPEGQELQNFILDLRYNKHGTVEMASLMGDLLVGGVEGVAGKTFAECVFNDAARNRTITFEAPARGGITPATIYILTSRHTAGAAELLINALRGLDQQVVKLVVVGETTQGLAAGMVKRTIADPNPAEDEGPWEYSAWMLAFTVRNAAGQGEYTYGLVPTSEVNELARGDNMKWLTTWEWKGQAGAIEDQLIKRAVDIIVVRHMMPAAEVVNSGKRSRKGFPRDWSFPTSMTMEVGEN
jgi:hypothetical protein